MQYNQEAIKQAREYTKYIPVQEIIDLVNSINKNDTDFNTIKKLLTDCLNNQLQKLPIESSVLKQNVFNAFCLMVKNAETHIIHFGIVKISYNNKPSTRKPTIPPIKTIAKICVDEWIQSYENNLLSPNVNALKMNAKKFFERRAIDDSELSTAMPELLKVIEDLYPKRNSKKDTRDYIEAWRKTKFKQSFNHTLKTGEDVEVFNNAPDMTIHDRFVNWLFFYFHKLYNEKTNKTIGYAFALEILTQIYNCQKGNLITHELPNTNIDDVLDVIDLEENDKETNQKTIDSEPNQQINSMSDNQKISSISKIDILYKGWRDVYDRWCVGPLEQVTHLFETEYPIYENGQRGEFNRSTIGFTTIDYQVEFEKHEIELIPANSPIFDIPEQKNNSNAYSIRYNQRYSVIDEYKINKTESKQLAKGIVGYIFVKLNEGFYSNFHIQIPTIGSAEFYQFFFDKQFEAFKQNRHDAWRDDLINEFMPIHIKTEQENIKQSEILFEYFPKNEKNSVLKYVKSYFDYLKYKFSNLTKQENFQTQQLLSQNEVNSLPKPKYTVSEVLKNYNYWQNNTNSKEKFVNIFKDIDEQTFLQMIDDADFTQINTRGIAQRVKFNVYILARELGTEWGEEAAKKLKTTFRECGKLTSFCEYEQLKGMYVQ